VRIVPATNKQVSNDDIRRGETKEEKEEREVETYLRRTGPLR
jgi:hypothetical protein